MTDPIEKDANLPDDLVAALRRADQPPAMIASRVDRVVGDLAAEQFASRPAVRRTRRAWYAVAASVLVVALVLQLQPPGDSDSLLYTDVDGSGQIDIADVMALALREDERYSKADLDAFAMHVVSLGDES